jgi:cell division septum initiation protein DivIVA
MESNQKVSLGCGTLILIALIVMIFSGTPNRDIKQELQQLQTEIRSLQSMVEAQRASIQKLQRTIEDSRKPESSGDHTP